MGCPVCGDFNSGDHSLHRCRSGRSTPAIVSDVQRPTNEPSRACGERPSRRATVRRATAILTLSGLFTFNQGGTMSEYGIGPGSSPALRSPGHGVWQREHGWQDYSFAFTYYRYNASGVFLGSQRVRAALELGASGDEFASRSVDRDSRCQRRRDRHRLRHRRRDALRIGWAASAFLICSGSRLALFNANWKCSPAELNAASRQSSRCGPDRVHEGRNGFPVAATCCCSGATRPWRVAQNSVSWNQIFLWLSHLDGLRQVA